MFSENPNVCRGHQFYYLKKCVLCLIYFIWSAHGDIQFVPIVFASRYMKENESITGLIQSTKEMKQIGEIVVCVFVSFHMKQTSEILGIVFFATSRLHFKTNIGSL